MRTTMRCPQCQTANPDVARFCLQCGGALARACTSCSTALPATARFCMGCGQPVGSAILDEERLTLLTAAAPRELAERVRAAAGAGERRVATILFVDVVGSTALAERLDPEDWKAVINPALDRFARVVYRYEGTIAQLLGDGLLAFFGAPVAHEDDPVRAVRAALDVVDAARAHARDVRGDLDFAVRVGVNTGTVVVGPVGNDLKYEYLAVGDAVNLAARLQAAARPMGVLVSERTARFLPPAVELVDRGPVEVKGRSEPVRAYEVLGAREAAAPLRGLAGLSSPMVGRERELGTLLELSAAVRAGVGRIAVVIGEPGIGKSRLVAEWRQAATAAGHVDLWAQGNAISYGQSLAYHLLADLVRSLLGTGSADAEERRSRLEELLGASALGAYSYLAHMLALPLDPAELRRLEALDPQTLQAQYLAALRQLLRSVASRGPVTLVLNDLHWGDPSSVDLLVKLLPYVRETTALLCLVTRPERDAPGWKLVAAARERFGDALTEFALQPLSQTESARVISHLLAVEALPARLRALILEKAEGNPLFVEEVVRALIERGAVRRVAERWTGLEELGDVDIPDNLQSLLLARIDRLEEGAKRTLRIASVIGRRFTAVLLRDVLGHAGDGEALPAQLADLESVGLVRLARAEPQPEYVFKHALVHDAAYASLLREDRVVLHRVVGETLERLHADRLDELAATLAHHFERSDAAERAREYLRRAAAHAAARYANDEAIQLYRRAIALVEPREAQEASLRELGRDLYRDLGEVLLRSGRGQEAEAAFRSALARVPEADALRRSALLRDVAAALSRQHRWEEQEHTLVLAEAALGPAAPDADAAWWREWASVQRGRMGLYYWLNRHEEMSALIERTRPVIERHGTSLERAQLNHAVYTSAMRRDRYVFSDETMGLVRSLFAAYRESGDEPALMMGHFQLGFAQLWRGDLDEAEREIGTAQALAERLGDVVLQSRCLTYLAVLWRKRGRADRARDYATQALTVATDLGMPEYVAIAKGNLAWVALRDGDLDSARALGVAAAGATPAEMQYPFHWTFLWPLLVAALARGDLGEARERARALLGHDQQPQPGAVAAALNDGVALLDKGAAERARDTFVRAVALAQGFGYA